MSPPKLDLFSEQDRKEFSSFFPEIVNTLTNVHPWNKNKEFQERLEEVLTYNVDFWTNSRGIAAVAAYKALEKSENLTKENIKLANILGWCGRLYEASLVMVDDIVDDSETRGKRPCWYKTEGVGINRAIFDSFYLNSGIYVILKKYFSSHPQYHALQAIFQDINFNGALGGCLDLMPFDPNKINMDNYSVIAEKAKTAFSFITAAMCLANYPDELYRSIDPVIEDLGTFYQVQNDYLDFFGNPTATGRIGSDIEGGRFTWLAAKALEKANPAQRAVFEDNYGRRDTKCVESIRNLYNELRIDEDYKMCENEMYNRIRLAILELPKQLNHTFLLGMLDALVDRKWVS